MTVHTSTKARLSWLPVVGQWRNDVMVAMPASAWPAPRLRFTLNAWLHVRVINFRIIIIIITISGATQSVDTTFRISQ